MSNVELHDIVDKTRAACNGKIRSLSESRRIERLHEYAIAVEIAYALAAYMNAVLVLGVKHDLERLSRSSLWCELPQEQWQGLESILQIYREASLQGQKKTIEETVNSTMKNRYSSEFEEGFKLDTLP
ncbi:hypothetical protein EOM33_04800 [Candidatus Saccharibacteria bacterium]|nr:hypothetical protein [Candidatus Saccharibacteria bacterium]